MRIAIYARYSSDLQNPVSIEDQLSLCTDLMKRQFGIDQPVATYTDAAISGATMSRPGLINLLDAAEARSFDVLIAEGLDRISRSLSDIATIHELLVHYGIKIWTGHEGEVSDLHVGFKGTMNALYLRDLKEKVKRAHRSIAASGRAASSVAYGYSVVRGVLDEKGNYVNGLRQINPDQAAVIKRIFKEYASGIPLRQIVRSLNDDSIPSPSGKLWRPNSITGEDHRYKGILHNDLYRGLLVYNRTHKIVDPRSGKRRYVVNPASEWITTPVPELRIISDRLWAETHQRRLESKRLRRYTPRKSKPRSAKNWAPANARPLTGLVKCGWCGGNKSIANNTRYVCSTHRLERKCKNARGQREKKIAESVFSSIRDAIEQEANWAITIRAGLEREIAQRRELDSEAELLKVRTDRLFDAIEKGIQVDPDRIRDLQERQEYIRSLPPLPDLKLSHDVAKSSLLEAIHEMQERWDDQKFARPIKELLSLIVDRIVCTPIPDKYKGEAIKVTLKPPRDWAKFYLHAGSTWRRMHATAARRQRKKQCALHPEAAPNDMLANR